MVEPTVHSPPAADPTAAILIIGAEVLSGKVTDENGPFLIRSLRQRGVRLTELRIIEDDVETISLATAALASQATFLFTTGGIGPTHDDVTMQGIAKAVGRPVTHHPDLIERVAKRYGSGHDGPHMRLAEVPEGATLLASPDIIIPAIRYENIFIFPGVPSLMRLAFQNVAHLLSATPLHSKALLLDASESRIAVRLQEVQRSHPGVAIGSYPRFDDAPYRVKVTVDSRDPDAIDGALAALRAVLEPSWIIGEA